MQPDVAPDEALIQRLPLPLAQLYRRAHNAKTPLERHLTAFYLWEAGLKLLASVAIVEYVQRGQADAGLISTCALFFAAADQKASLLVGITGTTHFPCP